MCGGEDRVPSRRCCLIWDPTCMASCLLGEGSGEGWGYFLLSPSHRVLLLGCILGTENVRKDAR